VDAHLLLAGYGGDKQLSRGVRVKRLLAGRLDDQAELRHDEASRPEREFMSEIAFEARA